MRLSRLSRTTLAIVAGFGMRHPEYARQRLLEARAPATSDAAQRIVRAREATALFENTLGPRHEATLAAKEVLAGELLGSSPAQADEAIGLLQEVVQTLPPQPPAIRAATRRPPRGGARKTSGGR